MAQSTESLNVARKYFKALSARDFVTVAGMFADDIVWHQPGAMSGYLSQLEWEFS